MNPYISLNKNLMTNGIFTWFQNITYKETQIEVYKFFSINFRSSSGSHTKGNFKVFPHKLQGWLLPL